MYHVSQQSISSLADLWWKWQVLSLLFLLSTLMYWCVSSFILSRVGRGSLPISAACYLEQVLITTVEPEAGRKGVLLRRTSPIKFINIIIASRGFLPVSSQVFHIQMVKRWASFPSGCKG